VLLSVSHDHTTPTYLSPLHSAPLLSPSDGYPDRTPDPLHILSLVSNPSIAADGSASRVRACFGMQPDAAEDTGDRTPPSSISSSNHSNPSSFPNAVFFTCRGSLGIRRCQSLSRPTSHSSKIVWITWSSTARPTHLEEPTQSPPPLHVTDAASPFAVVGAPAAPTSRASPSRSTPRRKPARRRHQEERPPTGYPSPVSPPPPIRPPLVSPPFPRRSPSNTAARHRACREHEFQSTPLFF
jgi:hypothetical protein